ncbi:hypothetical protein XM38_037560 [Halomicronema hongdechloris C2206]|uniref:VTT domain-containing protein n=1 Tax=Halomicronema hongdechloris C2206 TaxID=1641165 RepID=A0A1Z3HRN5_9CYAN|nr:YqaA family protein [Halomicronema hongdechloris]ASC72797.1 hypothetical protein XM38_037560 [Halomicronema hongdechloris C2206]
MLKRGYHWIAGLSHTPYGEAALFLIALAESSFFPIPPDVLLLALCAGQPQRSLRFAASCGIGSVLGGILGYTIGWIAFDSLGQPLLQLYDPQQDVFAQIETLYQTWGFWGVLAAAITPIPYKVFTIASGVFHFSLPQFILASLIGRNLRFFLVGGLMYWGGPRFQQWLEASFDTVAWSALAVMVIGIVAVHFL